MGRKSRFRLVEDIFQANAESVLAFIESANVLERRMMPVADSSKCFPTCDEFAFQFDISFDEARAVGRDPEAFQFDSPIHRLYDTETPILSCGEECRLLLRLFRIRFIRILRM